MIPLYLTRSCLITLLILFLCEFIHAQWALQKYEQFFNRNTLQRLPSSFLVTEKNYELKVSKIFDSNADSSVTDIDIQKAVIWLATADGADYSTNLGTTWSYFNSSNGLGRGGVCGLLSSNSLTAIATVFSQEHSGFNVTTGSGISFSTNNGTVWTHVPQPIDESSDSTISYGINDSLWILPILVLEQNVIYDIDQQKNTVWIASFAGGLRKSNDRGQHWQRILLPLDDMNSIKPTDTLWTLDQITQRKTYKKFDISQYLNLRAFSVVVENDSTIWCGTAGGINKSTDGGMSWRKFSHQNQLSSISGNFVVALHIQRKSNQNIIWASTQKTNDQSEESGISFTTNNGFSWSTALHGMQSWNISSYHDTVFVPTDHGLYRSVNGVSWQYFQPLINDTLFDAVKDTLNRIWVASRQGIRIFNDENASWISISVPANNSPTIESIIAPDTLIRPLSGVVLCLVKVYASDPQGTADVASVWFKSVRPDGQYVGGGSKFFLINDGNGYFSQTFSLDHNAQLGTYRWTFFAEDQAGNLSDSVIHLVVLIDPTLFSVGNINTLPTTFKLLQNFPNPFNPSTTIFFSLPLRSFVSLKVFDLIGKEVTTIVSEQLSAGNYSRKWNAEGLRSGVYFYQLQAGSFTETKKLILLK